VQIGYKTSWSTCTGLQEGKCWVSVSHRPLSDATLSEVYLTIYRPHAPTIPSIIIALSWQRSANGIITTRPIYGDIISDNTTMSIHQYTDISITTDNAMRQLIYDITEDRLLTELTD
jgi:hypothetical protein